MIEIRQCRAEDFDEVVALLRQLWMDKHLDSIQLRPIFNRALVVNSKKYLCATDGILLVGFGSLTVKDNMWPEGQVAYIDELVVRDGHRSSGVGKLLLEALTVVARAKGCCKIELDCAYPREKAHRFYEREGFEDRAFVFSKML